MINRAVGCIHHEMFTYLTLYTCIKKNYDKCLRFSTILHFWLNYHVYPVTPFNNGLKTKSIPSYAGLRIHSLICSMQHTINSLNISSIILWENKHLRYKVYLQRMSLWRRPKSLIILRSDIMLLSWTMAYSLILQRNEQFELYME